MTINGTFLTVMGKGQYLLAGLSLLFNNSSNCLQAMFFLKVETNKGIEIFFVSKSVIVSQIADIKR